MRKRFLSFALAIALSFTVVGTVSATNIEDISPQASAYLDAYGVGLEAEGGGEMLVAMSVDGVGVQDRIGVLEIDIDEKRNGVWYDFDEQYSADHSEFMTTNSLYYAGSYTFNGTPGRQYRVTITAYARKNGGSDTGTVTSPVVTCR